MDLNSLKDQVSNLTLYDIKAGVRKVQNAVMNYTEMESKVREATNNEPWGASSSLMQEIANGTHSYQLLNEIMPLIYKRFTDKTAEEWRQIYKSLQLLEYLVKNGSERVIDDARQHVSLLRMLRQFHYIDQNGKDQGVNVRNRAQELAKLLSDVDAIRSERKKARANRNKYGGAEGGISGGMSSGSRYGGFGSEDAGYGGYRGEVYGDGGGYGGNTSAFQDTQRRGDKFEEYDEDEEGGTSPAAKPSATSRARASSGLRAASLNTIKRDAKIKKEPEQDLFDFGDEPITTSTSNGKSRMTSPKTINEFGAMQSVTAGDDDFDDFQSATTPGLSTEAQRSAFTSLATPPPFTSTMTSSTSFAAPQPIAPTQASNMNDRFASMVLPTTSSSKPSTTPTPSLLMNASLTSPPTKPSTAPNYYTSVQSTINPPIKTPLSSTISPNQSFTSISQKQTLPFSSSSTTTTTTTSTKPTPTPPTKTSGHGSSGGADVFGSLWSTASNKAGLGNKSSTSATTASNQGPDLASMAKAKNDAAMWGTSAVSSSAVAPPPPKPNNNSMGFASSAAGRGIGMGGVQQQQQQSQSQSQSQIDDLLG